MDAQFQSSTSSGAATPETTDQEMFTRHKDSVLCCSIDNNKRLAVSGGIDDTAFVWDLNTKHVIFECTGHKESVVAADFSLNSTYVATGDLNGYIQVRNTTTGIRVFDYDIDEINWIQWHNSSEFVLLAGTTKGDFWMWNVNDPAAVKTFPSYGAASTGARLFPDGIKLVVTYQDGFVRVFDLKTRQTISQLSDHNRSEIISMDLNATKALLAIGSIDSSVKLITVGNLKIIGTLNCKSPQKGPNSKESNKDNLDEPMEQCESELNDKSAEETEDNDPNSNNNDSLEVIDEYTTSDVDKPVDDEIAGEDEEDDDSDSNDDDDDETDAMDSVESTLFSPCGNYLAASNNSGSIFIWEAATQAIRCELHTHIGITRCAWTHDNRYITACLDGAVRIYDINLNKLHEMMIHCDQILDLAFNGVLVTASEDKTCRVSRIE